MIRIRLINADQISETPPDLCPLRFIAARKTASISFASYRSQAYAKRKTQHPDHLG